MTITELEGLSVENRKEAILKISQFVLREPSANIRESLYKRILEIGIYLSNQKTQEKGLDGILDLVQKQFFGMKLEKEVAEDYLKQLENEGVIKLESGRFLLQEEKRIQLENYSKDSLALMSSCENNFVEEVKQKNGVSIPPRDIDVVRNCFYDFIIRLVSRYVTATAKLLTKGTLGHVPQYNGQKLADKSSSGIADKQLGESFKATIMQWMQTPDNRFIEYLFFMRQNLLCIEVLNLDPDCRTLEKEEFSKKTLFLDTNALLPLLLRSELHMQTRKLVENSRQLGCTIYVTKRTLKEFADLFDRAKKTLEVLRATPMQLSKGSTVIIRSYGNSLLSGNKLSPTEYVGQFSNVETILGDIGIKLFDEEHDEIKELARYDELVEEVQKSFYKMRWRLKTVEVAEHDAYHLLLIKTLRESDEPSILGPNKWFLTYDLTLPSVDNFVRRNFTFSEHTMAVMIPAVWNEIISPFLIGIVAEKDLVEVLKSFVTSDFTPLSRGIDFENLTKLDIDWTEYDWLEPHEIQQITNQRFVLDFLSRSEELANAGNSEELERLRYEFNLAFSRFVGRISSRKIEQVKVKLDEREKEAELLKTSISDLERTKTELQKNLNSESHARSHATMLSIRMRYVSGIAGIFLLAIGSLLVILMKETATWQTTSSYLAFLVLGAILLLMAIDPDRVSGILGMGRSKE